MHVVSSRVHAQCMHNACDDDDDRRTETPRRKHPTGGMVRLFVMQHGIDGRPADLDAVRTELSRVASGPDVQIWDTACNVGLTNEGIETMSLRLWAELRTKLDDLRVAGVRSVLLSFVGHSLGGLLLRRVAAEVLDWAQLSLGLQVTLDTFVSIATPHLGTRALGADGEGGVAPLVRGTTAILRFGLRVVHGRGARRHGTGHDLLLDSSMLDGTLVDDRHVAALGAFRRRVCLCNTRGDWSVPFATSSLCDAFEATLVRRVSASSEGVMWAAAEAKSLARHQLVSTEGVPAKAPMLPAEVAGVVCVALGSLPAGWDPAATAAQQRTWDDNGRAARACCILKRLRACGEWLLLPITFGDRASFLGGLRCPHVDIVALPGQTSSDVGKPVVRQLVRLLLDAPAPER